jgi:sulfite reductase alpha subunit-like flavoprotein
MAISSSLARWTRDRTRTVPSIRGGKGVQSTSEPGAPVLFFFGCTNQYNDFLCKEFWLSHAQEQGVLSLEKGGGFFAAFPRDQPHQVYVQAKTREQRGARVLNMLSSEEAATCVAG